MIIFRAQRRFLDRAIDCWHATLGLPLRGRDATPRNPVNRRNTRNDFDRIRVDHPVGGMGDGHLFAAKQLATLESSDGGIPGLRASPSVRAAPTPNSLGGGNMDRALWLSDAGMRPATTWNLRAGGVLLMSKKRCAARNTCYAPGKAKRRRVVRGRRAVRGVVGHAPAHAVEPLWASAVPPTA